MMEAEQVQTRPGTAPVTSMLDAAADSGRGGLVHGADRLSWAEVRDRADRLAEGLASTGLGPDDPVALVLPNVPDFALAFFAVARLGGVVVPLNPQFKEAELDFHFREAGVRAVVTDGQMLDTCGKIVADWDDQVQVISPVNRLIDAHSVGAEDAGSPGAEAVFQYSSGSTGRPKRVPRTHRQLRVEADSIVATAAIGPDDVVFCTIPLFHSYGMGCCLLAAVRASATLVLAQDAHPFILRRDEVLAELERERATVLPAVPFTFRLFAEAPGSADLSALRLCISAANALPRSTFDAFERKFGIPIRQMYGCTETGAVTLNLDEDPRASATSVGRPLQGVEVAIIDDAGEELEVGRNGEVVIRSPAMTGGYAGMDVLNRQVFRDVGYVSGDRGRLDENGRLFITGRKKLLIDVKGDKVDPIEVEDVLAVHPKVGEVVVVGVPSDVAGEELIKAVVVAQRECQERELIRYCRERLADYKVPQLVEFREDIPRSPDGSVLRKYLVE
jgi:long-chain acyl-CoA synthetase